MSKAAQTSLRVIAILCFASVLTLAVCQSSKKPTPEKPRVFPATKAPGDWTPPAGPDVDATPPDAKPKPKSEPKFFPATKAPGRMFAPEPEPQSSPIPNSNNTQQAPQ